MELIKFKNGSSIEILENVTDIKRSKPKDFMYEWINENSLNLYWYQRLYLKFLALKQKKRNIKQIKTKESELL